MSWQGLERLQVEGYKSIRNADIRFERLNVLIGANGSGKSNLIDLFRFMRRLAEGDLQATVGQAGGAESLLHYGRKNTDRLSIHLWFRRSASLLNGYACTLLPTSGDSFVFEEERVFFQDTSRYEKPYDEWVGTAGHRETKLWEAASRSGVARHVLEVMQSWQVYHFHDTSSSAKVKQTGDIEDNRALHADAGNLAAYLYLLREKHPEHYRLIVETIRLAAPFFGDFVLRPSELNREKIRLEWRERGQDHIFGAHDLSDGTLRFICLAALLLQPPERMPQTVVLDEPELGLHPAAIATLAGMMRSASAYKQIVVATQSVTLVNQFSPEEVIVVERGEDGASIFRRVDSSGIASWLEEYALGEVWEKNLIGGRPTP
ncbi:MAG: AAA family ATPase [Armatimonadota bacterium]|nr:AAA family ATPase [Armatimonadota bacterium]